MGPSHLSNSIFLLQKSNLVTDFLHLASTDSSNFLLQKLKLTSTNPDKDPARQDPYHCQQRDRCPTIAAEDGQPLSADCLPRGVGGFQQTTRHRWRPIQIRSPRGGDGVVLATASDTTPGARQCVAIFRPPAKSVFSEPATPRWNTYLLRTYAYSMCAILSFCPLAVLQHTVCCWQNLGRRWEVIRVEVVSDVCEATARGKLVFLGLRRLWFFLGIWASGSSFVFGLVCLLCLESFLWIWLTLVLFVEHFLSLLRLLW